MIENTEQKALQTMDSFENDLQLGRVRSSLDISTLEGKMLAQKAISDADIDNEVLEKESFPVKHVVMHQVRITNDDDESTSLCDRTVLIDPDGNTVAFVSEGIKTSMLGIMSIFGIPPHGTGYSQPVWVYVKNVKTRRKFFTKNLKIDFAKMTEQAQAYDVEATVSEFEND